MGHASVCRYLATVILSVGCCGQLLAQAVSAKPMKELSVLYVGTERGEEYVKLFENVVARIETVTREDFQPKSADGFDVVLLYWPQSEETREMRRLRSPLGERRDWNHPTVLIGSAGLNLAVAWKMQGGSGCTCMDPLAYGLLEHPIFEFPNKIDRTAMIRIPTPVDFRGEIFEDQISVLPLVDDYQKQWRAGWCSYSNFFDKNPDVEMMCGGVNHKTPTAAGIWRQGNFLHFGFEQSPNELNEHGKALLINSIAYIANFQQDRPIATTPSVFAGPIARPRRTPGAWLKKESYQTEWVLDMFEPAVRKKLEEIGKRSKMREWCDANSLYFTPANDGLLKIDEDLMAISLAFDAPEFIQRVLDDLGSGESATTERARRLLDRYVPCGPGAQASPKVWQAWYLENKPYLFALDTGDYCWYIDPLAKQRGRPTVELRGPSRADEHAALTRSSTK